MYKVPSILRSNWILLTITTAIYVSGFVYGITSADPVNKSGSLNTTSSLIHLIDNNLLVCGLIISGFFTFGLTTILYLFTNGLILGESIMNNLDFGVLKIVLLILPHGIFEIPALIVSGVIGFKGIALIPQLFHKKNISNFIKDYFTNILLLLIVVMLFVMISGLIETYLTPLFK